MKNSDDNLISILLADVGVVLIGLSEGCKYECVFLHSGENFTIGSVYTAEDMKNRTYLVDDMGFLKNDSKSIFKSR